MSLTTGNTKSSKSLYKQPLTYLLGIALIIGGISVNKLREAKITQPEAPIVTVPKITTVTALGRLEPQGEIVQVAAVNGDRLEELLAEAGTEVNQGDIIAVLDSRDRRLLRPDFPRFCPCFNLG